MPADLAILIVTLRRRRQYLARLMRRLEPQLSSRVALYTLEDQGAEKIGEKRQRMIEAVGGPGGSGEPWLCFHDDDDLPSRDYCSSILEALDQNPDVVGFRHTYYEDGKLRGRSVTSVRAKNWRTEMQPDGTAFHFRTPNHLNPVRTEMALAIGYKPMQAGEDADYSDRLFKEFLRNTEVISPRGEMICAAPMLGTERRREVFIDKVLYEYFYRTPNQRTEAEHLLVEDPC